ncbi:hypothetical protein LINGRAHAP2_LOCUS21900 [Linum grandiflorum]
MAASNFLMSWDRNAHQGNLSMRSDDASKSSKVEGGWLGHGDLIENHSHSGVLANKAHENDDISVDLDKCVEDGWHMPHHDHSKCLESMEALACVKARCIFHGHDDCKCMEAVKDESVEDYSSSSEIDELDYPYAMWCVKQHRKNEAKQHKKNEVKAGV